MASCSANDLATASVGFSTIGGQQLEWIKVYLLCNLVNASGGSVTCDAAALAEAASCFCGLSMRQLAEIQAELLCEILNSGGSGGQSCILSGVVDPTVAPPCSAALYYRSDTFVAWLWDDVGAAWGLLID